MTDYKNTIELEKGKKILGELIIEELPENTLKIRGNLIVFCSIALFSFFYDIDISNSTNMSFSLTGISKDILYNILFIIIFYNFIHFLFNIYEYILYIRLRLTGTKSHL